MGKKGGYLARAETAVAAAQDSLTATQTKLDRTTARLAELRNSDDPSELVERRGLFGLADSLAEDIRIKRAALDRETLALDQLRQERAELQAAAEKVADLPERNAPVMRAIREASNGVKAAIVVARSARC